MKFRVMQEPLYDLSDHPDIARALGHLVASWALVEHQLCDICAVILRAPPWRTQTAYYAITNNNARIDMIRASAQNMIDADRYLSRLTGLLDRAKTLANARNGYVHKLWLIHQNQAYQAEGLGEKFPFGEKRKVHAKELDECGDKIVTMADDLGEFVKDYSHAHPLFVPEPLHPSLRKK